VRTPLPARAVRSNVRAMRPIALASLLSTLVLCAGALCACGQSKADKASDKVCDARDDIAKQVKELQGLTLSTATVDQVTSNLNAIKDDLSNIADASGDLSDERRKDVQAANEEFKATMSQIATSVGKSLSLEDARTQVSQALKQLASSYQSTFGQLDCS
jgi:septal ring factor EnvC (AmiA/AmiB activator)